MKTITEIKEKVQQAELRAGASALFAGQAVAGGEGRGARTMRLTLYLAAALAVCAVYMAFVVHGTAFAQQGGGGGDVVQSALQKAIDWISGLMVALGTLGFLIAVCVKAVAGTNEGRHHMAHMGMAGAAIAVVAGLLAPGIMEIVAGFAG